PHVRDDGDRRQVIDGLQFGLRRWALDEGVAKVVRHLVELRRAIHVPVVGRTPDAIFRVVDLEAVEQDTGRDGMDGPVDVPRPQVADDERMFLVRPDAIDVGRAERHAAAEVEAVATLTMRLVVLEADEGQFADVDLLALTVGLQDRQDGVEVLRLWRLEEVAVLVALGGDVAGEAVEGVGPPEAGAVVLVERQDLFREWFGDVSLHGEVAVEDVEDLGAVLEEEAVALGLVADAVADDEVVGAVDGQPAVVAVVD